MTSRLNLSGPLEWPGGYGLLAAERRSWSARSELATPSRWLGRMNTDANRFLPGSQDGYLRLEGVSSGSEGGREVTYDRAFEG